MSTRQEYLKGRNRWLSGIFVALCLTIYTGFLLGSPTPWESMQQNLLAFGAKNGAVMAAMPITLLILSGLLTAGAKARLIFWRWRHALPGHRAFTELAPRDARIPMDTLQRKLGSLPTVPGKQNTVWYTIYRQYEHTVRVQEIHRKFLLARDLAVYAIILGIAGTAGLLIAGADAAAAFGYLGVMILLYLALAITARNYGKGFVCNVLVEYCNDSSTTGGIVSQAAGMKGSEHYT